MVVNHWFRHIEKVLEALEITSDATRIKLASFKPEGESQVSWDLVKASKVIEAMNWAEVHELFMRKYFPTTARHAKAQEFLDLKQGTMIVMEYMAKFTKLACFDDNYVAKNMTKVRNFENGLKLFIWAKIIGLLLQDMDSMVRTAMAIERVIEDAHNIRDAGTSGKRKKSQSSSSSGKKPKASSSQGFQGKGIDHHGQGQVKAFNHARLMTCYLCHHPRHIRRDCPQRQGPHGFGTV